MTEDTTGRVTLLLQRAREDREGALAELLPLVHDELRRIAGARMRGERRDHTLEPTALVHEAYLRLVDQEALQWEDRAGRSLSIVFGTCATLIAPFACFATIEAEYPVSSPPIVSSASIPISFNAPSVLCRSCSFLVGLARDV